MSVEDDVVPLNGADVLQERDIHMISFRVAAAQNCRDLLGLPVDDAGEDESQAAARVHLFVEFASIDPSPSAVVDISGHGVQLLDFQDPAADSTAQLRLGHVFEYELGFEDATQIPVRTVEAVLGAVGSEPFQSNRGGGVAAFQRGVKLPYPVPLPGDDLGVEGYARVSTDDQNLDLQRDALTKAACERIFEDHQSGAKADRPGLREALDYAREGDTLTVWRLDRLSRSLKDLIDMASQLQGRSIGLKSLHEALDTTSSSGKLIFHVFGALAEFERNLIRERTQAGLTAARARGRRGGRPKSLDASKRTVAVSLYDEKKQGHPVNGEVERGWAPSGSQICFPVCLSI